jgi:hypothetical protein
MSRLEDLRWLREQLLAAAREAEPNVLPQIAGQLRATLKELQEIEPADVSGVTGLVNFQERLAERQSRAKGKGRASSG